ncbi:MAG: glycosyltransferase [Ignavibacteriales bacterium]|nr:glycosyltransferase [Ignavibacteriales bacterium]MCF8435354.1 glycosyltransferase [Ignavibacteriales bacterium]
MDFSIIIPTLNEEKLLPGLLESINSPELRKLYSYEIIISDGGSTDGTIEKALIHADKITVHNQEQPQNIAAGRNKGAEGAIGDILVFLNADVRLDDPEISMQEIMVFKKEKNYDAATCYVKIFPEERIFSDKIFLGFYNYYFHLLNIIGVGMGRGEYQIIRKSVFERVRGYNESLPAGEDFDLFKRIRKHGKIKNLKATMVYEAPRRFRKYGHLKILLTWFVNSASVIFFKKSFSDKWERT